MQRENADAMHKSGDGRGSNVSFKFQEAAIGANFQNVKTQNPNAKGAMHT
jgi:hypothetical protein